MHSPIRWVRQVMGEALDAIENFRSLNQVQIGLSCCGDFFAENLAKKPCFLSFVRVRRLAIIRAIGEERDACDRFVRVRLGHCLRVATRLMADVEPVECDDLKPRVSTILS